MLNQFPLGKNVLPAGGVINNRAESPAGPSEEEIAEAAQQAAVSSAQASHVRTVVTRVVIPGAAAAGAGVGVVAIPSAGQPGGNNDDTHCVPDVASYKQSVMDSKADTLAAQDYQQSLQAAHDANLPDFGDVSVSFDVSVDC